MKRLLVFALFLLTTHSARAADLAVCPAASVIKPFRILADYSGQKVLGSRTSTENQSILAELLGTSILEQNQDGTFASKFLSLWKSSSNQLEYTFSLKDKADQSMILSNLKEGLLGSGYAKGQLQSNQDGTILLKLDQPRPRLYEVLTQLFPKKDSESDFLGSGPYQLSCEGDEGKTVQLKRRSNDSKLPLYIEISTIPERFSSADFVVSRTFSSKTILEQVLSKSTTTLSLLKFQADSSRARLTDLRKYVSCLYNPQDLSKTIEDFHVEDRLIDSTKRSCSPQETQHLKKSLAHEIKKGIDIGYVGQRQPFFETIREYFGRSGLTVRFVEEKADGKTVAQIVPVNVSGIEPAFTFHALCHFKNHLSKNCQGDEIVSRALTSPDSDLKKIGNKFFADNAFIPLGYFPLKIMLRKNTVKNYEELPSRLLNVTQLQLEDLAPIDR